MQRIPEEIRYCVPDKLGFPFCGEKPIRTDPVYSTPVREIVFMENGKKRLIHAAYAKEIDKLYIFTEQGEPLGTEKRLKIIEMFEKLEAE